MSDIKFKKIRKFKSENNTFNQKIVDEFEKVFVEGGKLNKKILLDNDLTQEVITTSNKELAIKEEKQFDAAKSIADSLGGKSKIKSYREDYGLWLWLTFAYAEQLIEIRQDGTKKLFNRENYWPNDVSDYQTAARHRIRTMCMLYSAHGEKADFILNRPLNSRGELTEQLSQSPEFTDTTIYLTFRKLFWNERKKSARRGYASKVCGARDLVAEIKKLMVTFAIEFMSVDEVVKILHPRFKEKWLGANKNSD